MNELMQGSKLKRGYEVLTRWSPFAYEFDHGRSDGSSAKEEA